MHEFRDAERVVTSHALTSSLARFLKKNDCVKEHLEFLSRRIFFAYPKTIWIKLAVDGPDELRTRLSLPEVLGSTLREWLLRTGFRTIVFDFRDVTIFDLRPLLEFLHIAARDLPTRYYLCEPLLAPLLIQERAEPTQVRHSEAVLLRELRQVTSLRQRHVVLPDVVSADKLDSALRKCAPPSALKTTDVVVFDMNAVLSLDFEASSMLTPFVTTLARRYGVLVSFLNMRRKVSRALEELGALRPVFSYVIGAREPAPAGPGENSRILPMHAFTYQQLTEINNLSLTGAQRILKIEPKWLNPASRLPIKPKWDPTRLRASLVFSLIHIINELNENVAMHSMGRGYLMMHMDLSRGLSVYVGDSGIGLAKVLSRRYDLPVPTDLRAVQLAFDLRQHRAKRRDDAGFNFGGRGLEKVRQILSEVNGEIRLQSGSAVALYHPSRSRSPIECSGRRYYVQGTHYNLFIPTARTMWKS